MVARVSEMESRRAIARSPHPDGQESECRERMDALERPTLSRESVIPALPPSPRERAQAQRWSPRQVLLRLPLPWGEGWGEGTPRERIRGAPRKLPA